MRQTECCPKFDPIPWNDHVFEWDEKKFIKDKVNTFFNIPMNFGSAMKRLVAKMKNSGVESPNWICLSNHTSKWNMDVYVEVEKEIPDATNTTISGKFFSKVYEGSFSDTSKWCKDYKEHAKHLDLKIKKWYMWYTTCPKCAKKFGKNYVVILGEIE